MNSYYPMSKLKQLQEWRGDWNMIKRKKALRIEKIDEIEIRSVRYKTLDNGACGVVVEWTTLEILPNTRLGFYSLPYENFKEYCEKSNLFNWCKTVIFVNNHYMSMNEISKKLKEIENE